MMSSWTLRRSASVVAALEPRLVGDARRTVEHQHAVADLHRLVDLVGDEHRGLVALPHQAHELGAQIARGHLVERGERLVAQQNFRIDREGARDRHALAHAARERVRIVVLVAGEAEPRQPAPRGLLRLGRIGVEDLQAEPHIVERATPRHQPVVLEHDADLAAEKFELAERIVADDTGLAGTRLDQAGDDVEHGGLAATGLAKHRDDLALGDFERQLVDGDEVAAPVRAAERLAHVLEADDRIGVSHDLHRPLGHRAIAQRPVLDSR